LLPAFLPIIAARFARRRRLLVSETTGVVLQS
jgi:hypothetical protein